MALRGWVLAATSPCGESQNQSSTVTKHTVCGIISSMTKGDFTTATITNFGKGLNLVDPREELGDGYLGPYTRNVQPIGGGRSLKPIDSISSLNGIVLANSATRRPVQFTPYLTDLLIGNNDGSVDRVTPVPVITSYGAADAAGIPTVVVSQDSVVAPGSPYYAYILRPTASGVASTKVHLGTNASVAWPTNPKGSCGISWKTRMVIAQGSRVLFSKEADPDTWPANNFIDIKTLDDASDDIVGFQIIGENLLVFKASSVWEVFDPVTFDNRRLFSVGLVNRRCSYRLLDRVYWLDYSGVYSTDGSEIREEAKKLKPVWDPLGFGFPNVFAPTSNPNHAALVVTDSGTIVVTDGWLGVLLGYTQYPDIVDGSIPWYPMHDFIPRFHGLGIDSTGRVLSGVWDQIGANTNGLWQVIDSGVQSAQVEFAPFTFQSARPLIELPTIHNSAVEGYSRLRRLNIYGHGTLGTTNTGAVEVFTEAQTVDPAGSPAFFKAVGSFTNEAMRVRPELRAKTFVVLLFGVAIPLTFQIHGVEAQFRSSGR